MKKWYSHLILGKQNQIHFKYKNAENIEFETADVNSGSIIERADFIRVDKSCKTEISTKFPAGESYSIQIKEIIPDNERGIRYSYGVYLNEILVHVRDYSDCGGGPYISTFIEIDKGITAVGNNTIKIELLSGHANLSDLFIYPDIIENSDKYELWKPEMEIGFLLSQYNKPLDAVKIEKIIRQLKENIELPSPFKMRFTLLVTFLFNMYEIDRVNTIDEEREIFKNIYELFSKFDIPVELRFITDWSGTPVHIKDCNGIPFSDIKYQQITYSPSQVKKDEDVWDLFENNKDPKIREYFKKGSKPKSKHFGDAISLWGNKPWLSFNTSELRNLIKTEYDKLLNTYSDFRDEMKLKDGKDLFVSDCGIGHEILYFSSELDSKNRLEIQADFNPETIKDSQYLLDPRKGIDIEGKMWMHNNLANYNKFLADAIYEGLKRERIIIKKGKAEFSKKMIKHRIRSETYAYPNNPLKSELYPISEIGMTPNALPGSQWFHSDVFKWLQKHREFGILANPNDECLGIGNERKNGFVVTPKSFSSDLAAQLRLAYAMGCEYIVFYNWSKYPESLETINATKNSIVRYWSAQTGDFIEEIEIEISEEYKFNNRILLEFAEGKDFTTGMNIQIIDEDNKSIAYRYISKALLNESSNIIEISFNELFCLYPDMKYKLILTHTDNSLIKCKNARIGADLETERKRSHLIGNRKCAHRLHKRIANEVSNLDLYSKNELEKANESILKGEYHNAILYVYKADLLKFPIRYIIDCKGGKPSKIEPFELYLETDVDAVVKIDIIKYNKESIKMNIVGNEKCTIVLSINSESIISKKIKVSNNEIQIDIRIDNKTIDII